MLKVFKPITKGLTSKATRAEMIISLVIVSILVIGSTIAVPIVYRQITKSNTGLTAIDKPAEQPKPLRPVDTSQETDNPDTIDQTDLTGSEPIPVDTSSPEAFRQNTIAEYERQRGQREALERLNALRAPLLPTVAFEPTDQATIQKYSQIRTILERGGAINNELLQQYNSCWSIYTNDCEAELEAYQTFNEKWREAGLFTGGFYCGDPTSGGYNGGYSIEYGQPARWADSLAEAEALLAKPIPTNYDDINALADEFETLKAKNPFGVDGNWHVLITGYFGIEFYFCHVNIIKQYDISLLDW